MKVISSVPADLKFSPVRSIVVYEGKQGEDKTPKYVAMMYRVENGKCVKPNLVSANELRQLLDSVEVRQKGEFIPENVLMQSADRIAWWEKGCIATLNMDKAAVTVPLPPMAYLKVRDQKNIKVWALKENKRPTPDTDLYCVPFPQWTRQTGGVHLCGVRVPSAHKLSNIPKWVACVLESRWRFDSGVEPLRQLEGKKKYPIRSLKPAGYNLGRALRSEAYD